MKKTMKVLSILLFALNILIGFTACNNAKTPASIDGSWVATLDLKSFDATFNSSLISSGDTNITADCTFTKENSFTLGLASANIMNGTYIYDAKSGTVELNSGGIKLTGKWENQMFNLSNPDNPLQKIELKKK